MAQRILVTGIGGAPGFDLARSLMRLGYKVIGTDSEPLAYGLALDGITTRTLPPAGHPDYAAHLLHLCRTLRPHGLLSTVEAELPMLLTLRASLGALGVRTWLPGLSAVQACGDKARFHDVMTQHGIPTPRSVGPEAIDDLPDGLLVVKPRRGQGAKNVHVCHTRQQARILCELVPDPIVQEHITGREFTADCLIDRVGRASVIPRWRLLVKAGLSMVSATFEDQAVIGQVRHALEAVGMEGVCCVQGFVSGDQVILTEINARIAGAFPCAEAAGAALVEQAVNGLFGRPVDHDRLSFKPGVYLTKCFETLSLHERDAR
ncbi:ATP-grasp domain-containing protein [Streptomyces sp. NPDC059010]|uniref:ATP-grasp domain-containing protein n=1 Tax=Streptomyces sp. NPDC059010 TaxID=3346695 RepID=UPI003687C67B